MNTLRTGLLMVAVGVLAVVVGAAFFGVRGAVIGLIVAFAFQMIGLFSGHKMALAFAKARPLGEGELPWLHEAVRNLSDRAGIPSPKLYVSPDPQPNAFAAGRNPSVAVICVNEGLLRLMPRDQVVSVLAHELGHVRNRDMLTMTVTAAMVSFINMLAYLAWFIPVDGGGRRGNPLVQIAVLLLAPITATLIQLAISRQREFAADRASAELVGSTQPMIEALRSLDSATAQIPSMTARPATAHMYIASPFGKGQMALFRTHPTTDQRIEALRRLRLA